MASKVQLKTREKGAGTIYRDGKRWYLKVRIDGKAKTTMLRNTDGQPCTTEKEATTAAEGYRKILFAENREEMAVQIAEAKKLRKQSGLLLSDAWQTYLDQTDRPDSGEKTLKERQAQFLTFVRWIKKEYPKLSRVSEVSEDIAQAYFSAIWARGVSAKTFNLYRDDLRIVFKHLLKAAMLEINPFETISKKLLETASRQEFTPEQVNAIFDGFNDGFFYDTVMEKLTTGRKRERVTELHQYKPMNSEEMRVLLNLCCWTGCRGQDGCLMQWKNVNLDNNRISFIPRKTARKTNHRAVTIPIHPALKTALLDALQWRENNKPGEDYILPKVAERYYKNHSGVQKDVMKIIRCATGLETTAKDSIGRRKLAANAYSLHSFRHTFVSFCANAGVPLAVVAEIVGHGSPAMTRHYSHINTEAKQRAVDALPMIGNARAITAPESLKERILSAIEIATESDLMKIAQLLKI